MGGGIFAALSIIVAALGVSQGGNSVLLALLVLIAGIGAIASAYGIAHWVRRRRRTRFWVSGALSIGVLALIVGGLTFVDPTPIHLQKAAAHLGKGVGSYPVTEKQANHILNLPVYGELEEYQLLYVAKSVRSFYGANNS
jgi:hypothetical protein